MTAITADGAAAIEGAAKKVARMEAFDMALAMHLVAPRFGSPAGIAFLPQGYLPFLMRRRG